MGIRINRTVEQFSTHTTRVTVGTGDGGRGDGGQARHLSWGTGYLEEANKDWKVSI
jgi:hypothetical protein